MVEKEKGPALSKDEMKFTGSKERRRYIRTGSSVPITFYFKEDKATKEVLAYTRNISATGMMIEIGKKIVAGSNMKMDINTPNSTNPVHCKGKIIWSVPTSGTGKYYCGIEFTKIEEDNKNTFLKFLCDAIYKASEE